MSNTNTTFNTIPVRVPNKSGFNCDHEVLGTMSVGTLVPLLCDELAPNTSVNLGALANLELPPFATDFNGKVDFTLRTFFVPMRLCWDGWKSFISRQNQYDPDATAPSKVPTINVFKDATNETSLVDALGMTVSGDTTNSRAYSALPLLAYNRIYNDWYRDARIQKSLFKPVNNSSITAGSMPWSMYDGTISDALADGSRLRDFRQANYARDYFTTAMLNQSLGENLRVKVDFINAGSSTIPNGQNLVNGNAVSAGSAVDIRSGASPYNVYDVGFTIAQLRTVNSLQTYMDTLGAAGNRYEDVMRSIYGCSPADEVLNKPLYLGSSRSGIYSHGVMQATASSESKNPYNGIQGAQAGVANSTNSASLVDSWTAREAGYLFVIACIEPHAYYSTITDRQFRHIEPTHFATGILAGAGNQEIYNWELDTNKDVTDTSVFGWTDRYAEYKFKNDRVFGGFKDGRIFDAFALKRGFVNPVLSTSFLQIPKNALYDVLAYTDDDPEYMEARVDCFFKYHKVQELPAYSIPTLGLPMDTHTEMISRGGTRL